MNKKTIFIFLFSILLVIKGFAQQDPQYSQYMFNPLVLNPAYAGSREVMSAVLLYRNQWVNLDGAPNTLTASFNTPLKNNKIGLGLHIVSDKIGPKTTNEYVASYAYRLKLAQGKLALGLRAGVYDYRFDWNKIDYKDKDDVFNANQQTHVIKPTFDFGMYYYTKSFYAGAAFSHLSISEYKTTNNITDFRSKLVPHFVGTVGKAFEINSKLTFRPTAVVRLANKVPPSIDVNASVLLDEKLWLGVGLRSDKDLVFIAEFNISKLMRVGYSYDAATQKIYSQNHGSHEIFIGFDIDFFQSKTISPRIFKYN